MTTRKIDITSDLHCPFCLIGVHQMLNAVEKYKTDHPTSPEWEIRLLPYQLDPNLTEQPIKRIDFYKKKFGEDKADQILDTMGKRLESLGFKSDYGGTVSSTHLVHRLQTYTLCRKPSKQVGLAMEIFKGFHGFKKDPNDKEWLSSLSVQHEIFENKEKASEWLNGNECDEQVKQSYLIAKRLGVTGVPFFVFQDKFAASGALGEEEFIGILEEIDKRENETPTTQPPSTSANSCPTVPTEAQRWNKAAMCGETCPQAVARS